MLIFFAGVSLAWRFYMQNLHLSFLPSMANTSMVSSVLLNVLNMFSITPFSISCSLNAQTVLLSGTLSFFFNPRKRLKFALLTIWYSNWSFERLYKLCIIYALNIIILSKGSLLFFENSFSSSINAPFKGFSNILQLINSFNIFIGSPNLECFSNKKMIVKF